MGVRFLVMVVRALMSSIVVLPAMFGMFFVAMSLMCILGSTSLMLALVVVVGMTLMIAMLPVFHLLRFALDLELHTLNLAFDRNVQCGTKSLARQSMRE